MGPWLAFSGRVLDMLLRMVALGAGVVKLNWQKEAAELLLVNLSLFFVLAGVRPCFTLT